MAGAAKVMETADAGSGNGVDVTASGDVEVASGGVEVAAFGGVSAI